MGHRGGYSIRGGGITLPWGFKGGCTQDDKWATEGVVHLRDGRCFRVTILGGTRGEGFAGRAPFACPPSPSSPFVSDPRVAASNHGGEDENPQG
jgi:hypothetical protein